MATLKALFPPPGLAGARKSLPGDALAGLTLAAIAVPGSMGAAQLVGASAFAGLVAFMIGAVVFALLGGHRILSVGADSSIAPMLAAAAAGGALTGADTTGELTVEGHPVIDPATLMLTSVLVGAILIIVGLVRAGWITQFLSRPVTIGLLAGIGVGIIIDQLPVALGIPRHGGGVIAGIVDMVTSLDEINWWTAAVAVLVLAITLGSGLVGPRVPGPLLGIAAAIAFTMLAGLTERGVVTLPEPDFAPPRMDFASVTVPGAMDLLPTALVIAVLVVIQTGATEASFPGPRRTLDRDLGVIGLASATAGAAGAFAVNTSPPRTSVVAAAKGKSQVVGLVAALIVLAVGVVGADLLPHLPTAALAAVLLTVAAKLVKVKSMARILRFSRIEFAVCIATILLVVLLGVVQGVIIAALVTLLDRTRREARPRTYRKGMIPKSNHWVPVDAGTPTVQVPGVLVWSVEAPLWYADSDFVVDQLHDALADADAPTSPSSSTPPRCATSTTPAPGPWAPSSTTWTPKGCRSSSPARTGPCSAPSNGPASATACPRPPPSPTPSSRPPNWSGSATNCAPPAANARISGRCGNPASPRTRSSRTPRKRFSKPRKPTGRRGNRERRRTEERRRPRTLSNPGPPVCGRRGT